MNYTLGLHAFIAESNRIEGIYREPYERELEAAERFLQLDKITATSLGDLQHIFAPGKPLREKQGMNVYVGNYTAPAGGHNLVCRLQTLCRNASKWHDPWRVHVAFEMLHPYLDGNGRTGRMLWAWCMKKVERDPFALPFLHRFYYQTLEHQSKPKSNHIPSGGE